MSEYRSVNYYELCRLCAATQGNKVQIFSEEGRRNQLKTKIDECLPVKVDEQDRLPKIICELCVQQLNAICEYRQKSLDAQKMLESCLNTNKLRNEGKVYIKDDSLRAGKPATNIVTLKNSSIRGTALKAIAPQPVSTPAPQANNVTLAPNNDFLSNIVQAVGIQMDDSIDMQQGQQVQSTPQYTFTLDNSGQSVNSGQIQYTIKEIPAATIKAMTESQRVQQTTYANIDEFLKIKAEPAAVPTVEETAPKDEKPKYNFVLTSSGQLQPIQTSTPTATLKPMQITQNTPLVLATAGNAQQQTASTPKAIQLQDLKVFSNKQSYVPLTVKVQPDGQTYLQLAPASTANQMTTFQQQPHDNIIFATAARPQQQQVQTQQIQTVQFANPQHNAGQKMPHATITIQKQPGQPQTATQITTIGRKGSTTITRKTPLVLNSTDTSSQQQPKTITYSIAQPTQGSNPIVVSTTAATPTLLNHKLTSPNKVATTTPQKTYRVVLAAPTGISGTTTATTPTAVITTSAVTAPTMAKVAKREPNDSAATAPAGDGTQPTCDQCFKTFKRKEHLAQHKKLHAGVRPFKCEEEQCNKAFNRKEHLMRHVVSHTGTKMFKCEFCKKLFSRKDNLNKHKKKHPEAANAMDVSSTKKIKVEVKT